MSELSQIRIQIRPGVDIWSTSDTHLGHRGIVSGLSEWKSGTRNFETLEDHDDAIIDAINTLVKPDDILIHNGDFCFGPKENVKKYRDRINCKNIYLLLGNHDDHIKDCQELQKLFVKVGQLLDFRFSIPVADGGKHIKHDVIFSHYSMNTWNMSNRGSIMLFGHSHGMLKESPYRTMDVGIDTNEHMQPYDLINDVLPKMLLRPFRNHHPEELPFWQKALTFLKIKKYEQVYRR